MRQIDNATMADDSADLNGYARWVRESLMREENERTIGIVELINV
jgi:hypothetical protein